MYLVCSEMSLKRVLRKGLDTEDAMKDGINVAIIAPKVAKAATT